MARKKAKKTTRRHGRRRIGKAGGNTGEILEMIAGAAVGAVAAEFLTSGTILPQVTPSQWAIITAAIGGGLAYFNLGPLATGAGIGMVGNGVVHIAKDNQILKGVNNMVIAGPSLNAVVARRRLAGLNAVVAGLPKPGGLKATAGMY